jgi:hypothetical protein
MDEQLQKTQILQSLNSIYSWLIQGVQIEISMAGLIFIAYNTLKHYWLGISNPSFIKKALDEVDEIEEFLKRCAELD